MSRFDPLRFACSWALSATLGGCGPEPATGPEHIAVHRLEAGMAPPEPGLSERPAEEAVLLEARLRDVARAFLTRRGADAVDLLVVWGSSGMFRGTSYLPLRNDIEGLGPGDPDGASTFDRTGDLGSPRLQGIVWMGDWLDRPARGGLESVLGMLLHETGHRWAATLRFTGRDGRPSDRLLARDGYHWSFLLDNGGSPLGGNAWRPRGGRRFEAVALEALRYSRLDLYAMGLLPAEEVGPLRLLTGASASFCSGDVECSDGLGAPLPVTLEADDEEVRLEQIIEVEGERRPPADRAPRTLFQAWIYVTSSDAPDRAELERLDELRGLWESEFAFATGGLGAVQTEPTNRR